MIDLVAGGVAPGGVLLEVALETRAAELDLGAEHGFFRGVEGDLVGCCGAPGVVEPLRCVGSVGVGGFEGSSGATGPPAGGLVEFGLGGPHGPFGVLQVAFGVADGLEERLDALLGLFEASTCLFVLGARVGDVVGELAEPGHHAGEGPALGGGG